MGKGSLESWETTMLGHSELTKKKKTVELCWEGWRGPAFAQDPVVAGSSPPVPLRVNSHCWEFSVELELSSRTGYRAPGHGFLHLES